MIDHAHDLAAVFYGPEFAALFSRERLGAPDLEMRLILGTVDEDVLEGRAVGATRTAQFAGGQDVRADDLLVALEDAGIDVPAGTAFTVLDKPRRVNDGNELQALLGSV